MQQCIQFCRPPPPSCNAALSPIYQSWYAAYRKARRATVYTCGLEPLSKFGVESAHKTSNKVGWRHNNLTHGFLQTTAWSEEATQAVEEIGENVKNLSYNQLFID
jgi:hypothetical protein